MKPLTDKSKCVVYGPMAILLVLTFWSAGSAEWQFDWSTRTDRHGKPAGHFDETPFPIDENSTAYSIMNDENPSGKTYHLGTKYFVDGRNGDDANDGLSLAHAKATINGAIDAAASGNKTIIIRGGHDGWNGVYVGTISLLGHYGTDDTHRFTLVGYGQERPIIDGDNLYNSTITTTGVSNAYVTIQRLKIQNTQKTGVRLGAFAKSDSYFNCIDIWFYECGNRSEHRPTDGSCYYLDVEYGWIFHCTSERTYGHGYKIGDGSSHHILEWSIARYIGYWPGIPSVYEQSPVAFDYPNDNDAVNAHDNVLRYSIGHTLYWLAVQLRRVRDFNVHHNEFYDAVYFDDLVSPSEGYGRHVVLVFAGQSGGDFHSNVVRGTASANTNGIYVTSCATGNPTVSLYNNLLYDTTGQPINIGSGNTGTVNVMNNSVYANNLAAAVFNWMGTSLVVKNNIIYQAGSGSCVSSNWGTDPPTHSHNLFYAPSGSVGVTLGTGEIAGDPQWLALPSGIYSPEVCALSATSPARDVGTDLSAEVTGSFNGETRPQGEGWDMGAFESVASQHADVREEPSPMTYTLAQNAPNPFNPSTVIRYQLPESQQTSLIVHDIHGRVVRHLVSRYQNAGYYQVSWDGRDSQGILVASGLYIARLKADGSDLARRMMLIR